MHEIAKNLRDFATTMTCTLPDVETAKIYGQIADCFRKESERLCAEIANEDATPCPRCEGLGNLYGKDGLTTCPFCNGSGCKIPPPPSFVDEPPPHDWKVGDYALCPDGQVRRLTHAPFYCFHDLYECDIRDCTPVPEPPMPELRNWGMVSDQMRYKLGAPWLTLDGWIAALTTDGKYLQEELPKLLALAEWRKLTGRDI